MTQAATPLDSHAATSPDVSGWLRSYRGDFRFLLDLKKLVEAGTPLTPGQVQAVVKAMDRDKEAAANLRDQNRKIRDSLDCRTVAAELGIRKGKGGAWHCFSGSTHSNGDANPSLSIQEKGFHCNATSCAIKGDVFDLVMKVRGVGLPDARRWLCDRFNLSGTESVSAQTSITPPLAATPKPHQGIRHPSPAAQKLMADLWAIVKPIRPTPALQTYLEGRGIMDHGLAIELGVRDFFPAAHDIKSLIRGTPDDTLKEAGLMSDRGDLWEPLWEIANGNQAFAGACFPVHHPAHPEFPMEWRWRWYGKPPRDGLSKAHALHGSNRLHTLGLNLPHKARRVLVCEGEMDYLTLLQALPLTGAPAYDVVALCVAAARWPDEFTKRIADSSLVAFVGHLPKLTNGRGKSDEIRESLERVWGVEKTSRQFISAPVPEDDDLNDRFRKGTFTGWLEQLMADPRWVTCESQHNTAAQGGDCGSVHHVG